MTTLAPLSSFTFSYNSSVPIFSICPHSRSGSSTLTNYTVTTSDQTHLLKATPSGLTRISDLNITNVRHQPCELGNDSVFGIDSDGKAFIIDWRLGTTVMEMQLTQPELSEEVAKSAPSWVYGIHPETNRVAYGFGNYFSVGDFRKMQQQNDVLFEEMHSESLRQLQFERNGELLCSAGVDGLIQFFDMKQFSPKVDPDELLLDVINLEDSAVDRFVLVDDKLVFSIADDQNLRVHSLDDNLLVSQPLNISAFSASFYIDLLPSRHVFVGNPYGDIFLASLTAVQQDRTVFEGVCVLKGHKDVPRCVSWNGNDSHFILSGDDQGVVCMWNVRQSGSELQQGEQQQVNGGGSEGRRQVGYNRERQHRPY